MAAVNYRVALGAVALAAMLTGVGAAQSVPGGVPGNQTGAGTGASAGSGTAQPPAPPLPNTSNRTPSPAVTTAPAPSPSASASPGRGKRGRGPSDAGPSASASETPVPPQFSTFDGTWEVQLQPPLQHAIYSHLAFTQKGNDLTGTWSKDGKTKLPFTGSWDGSRLFKLTLKDPSGKELTMSGYEENYGDMVGVLDDGKTRTAFTASHRKKLKFSDQAPTVGVPGLGGSGR